MAYKEIVPESPPGRYSGNYCKRRRSMSFGRRRTGREDGLGRSARPSQAREHIRDLVLIAPAEQQEKRRYSGGSNGASTAPVPPFFRDQT